MRNKLLELGFEELPHKTIGNALVFYVRKKYGKTRVVSISSLETPNEVITIGELDFEDNKKYENLTMIHNFDFDGYITFERIKFLLFSLTGDNKFNSKE